MASPADRVRLGLPVLAAVPEADISKVPRGGTCMTDDPGSAQAESFRTLRASLSLMGEEEHRRLILVTSSIPSEGKTFTSMNLAASFATQGLRTLLIDADLFGDAACSSVVVTGQQDRGQPEVEELAYCFC